MQISLPESIARKAERLASERGFESVGAYVAELVESDASMEAPFQRRKAEVEEALLAGLASSPPTPLVRSDWDELRRRVRERHVEETTTS